MTELVIDGKTVALPENLSLKLTVANPLFTDADSFTYDIEIPVGDSRNAAIFGQLNRLDSAKGKLEMSARLTVDNVLLLDGSAVVTSVSESAVKLQLLGDRTAYNYDSTENAAYIDGLWLGTIKPGGSVSTEKIPENWTSGNRGQHAGRAESATSAASSLPEFHDPEDRWVKYPILNTTNERVANDYLFYQDKNGNLNFGIVNVWKSDEHLSDMRSLYQTIQPKLWWICQLVAEASGYSLDKDDNGLYTDPFFRKIFIANTVPNCALASILPHWSVGEFWSYLRQAFGMVTSISGNRMRLMPRVGFHSQYAEAIPLTEVEDSFDCDVDDDESSDISSSNTAFASFENDPCDILDSSVTSVARYDYSFDDIEDIRLWWKSLAEFRKDNYRDTIFRCKDGREYIYFKERFDRPVFAQVNQFAPRVTDKERDNEVEIKFVPCAYHDHVVDIAVYVDDGRGSSRYVPAAEPVNTTAVTVLGRPDRDRPVSQAYILEEIIDGGDSGEEQKDDVIYIGLTGSTMAVTIPDFKGGVFTADYPDPNLRERWIYNVDSDTVSCEHRGDSLGLILNNGVRNIGSATTGNGVFIDTKAKLCVKFHAPDVPDPTHLFNIRNRLYACERIEVTITAKGKQPMMTGYFFPAFL